MRTLVVDLVYSVQLGVREMNFEKKKGHPSSVILAELFPQNVLSPEGRCVAYPVGVQLFLLMFYFGLGNEL